MLNSDPTRSTAEILADIKSTAESLHVHTTANIWVPVSALLVRLSNEAAAETAKTIAAQKELTALLDKLGREARTTAAINARSQFHMLCVTAVVLLVTIVMLGVTVAQYLRDTGTNSNPVIESGKTNPPAMAPPPIK